MTRPVVSFAIHGRDPTRLREFYGQLFGWEMNADNPMGIAFIPPASVRRG
jgi:predicted enzyme related to lactoylglutathione lyase